MSRVSYESLYEERIEPLYPFMYSYFNPVPFDIRNKLMEEAYAEYVKLITELSKENIEKLNNRRSYYLDENIGADVLQESSIAYTPSDFITYAELEHKIMFPDGVEYKGPMTTYLRCFIDEKNKVMFTYNNNMKDCDGSYESTGRGRHYSYNKNLSFRENVIENLLKQIQRDISPLLFQYGNLHNYSDYIIRLFSNIPQGFTVYNEEGNFDLDASINAIINHFKYEKELGSEIVNASKRFSGVEEEGIGGYRRTPEQVDLRTRGTFIPTKESTSLKYYNDYDD